MNGFFILPTAVPEQPAQVVSHPQQPNHQSGTSRRNVAASVPEVTNAFENTYREADTRDHGQNPQRVQLPRVPQLPSQPAQAVPVPQIPGQPARVVPAPQLPSQPAQAVPAPQLPSQPARAAPAPQLPSQPAPVVPAPHLPSQPAHTPEAPHGGQREERAQPEIIHTGDGTIHLYIVIQSLDGRQGPPKSTNMSLGVNLVRNMETGKKFVEKRVSIRQEFRKERAKAEVNALKQVRKAGGSKHINSLIEHFYNGATNCCHMILELCDAGTLHSIIWKFNSRHEIVSEAFVWHVLTGLAKALCMLHYGSNMDRPTMAPGAVWNCICNLDIKPANIFLTSQGKTGVYPRVVLGDFGCAVTRADIEAGKAEKAVLMMGTQGWFPPEAVPATDAPIWRGRYGKPTDIWQVGAVIQVLCKQLAVPDMAAVQRGRPCGSAYSRELNSVVSLMMSADLDERLTTMGLMAKVQDEMEDRGVPI